MKQATILATMEVGRLINHRENTPQNTQQTKPPRLLKARLKPLGTVQDVGGPMIYQCAGIRAGQYLQQKVIMDKPWTYVLDY